MKQMIRTYLFKEVNADTTAQYSTLQHRVQMLTFLCMTVCLVCYRTHLEAVLVFIEYAFISRPFDQVTRFQYFMSTLWGLGFIAHVIAIPYSLILFNKNGLSSLFFTRIIGMKFLGLVLWTFALQQFLIPKTDRRMVYFIVLSGIFIPTTPIRLILFVIIVCSSCFFCSSAS